MKYVSPQFNSTRRINPGAYSKAAQNLIQTTNNLYEINRKTAPDYSNLAQTAMEVNKALGVAGIRAMTNVTTAGIKTVGDITAKKEVLKGKEALAKAKRAGRLMLYGGGAIMQGLKMAGRKPIEKPEPIYGVETPFQMPDSPYKGRIEGLQGEGLGPAPVRPNEADYIGGNSQGAQIPFNPGSMDTPPALPNPAAAIQQPPAQIQPYNQQQSTAPTETYTKEQLKGFALDAGFSPDVAPTMARIAMGESSGNPRAFNNKGADLSYGLMQINMLGAMGPERRAKYGLTSNEDLYDPATNFRVAKGVYDSQGLGAWSAYTNGSYLNY